MSNIILAEYKLSDSEKEERQAERLMPSARKPHPKKKHNTERRSKRPAQRRTRINIPDSDLEKSDPDMSLKMSFSIPDMALRISAGGTSLAEMYKLFHHFNIRSYDCLIQLNSFRKQLEELSPKLKQNFNQFLETNSAGLPNSKEKIDLLIHERGKEISYIKAHGDKRDGKKVRIKQSELQEIAEASVALTNFVKENQEASIQEVKVGLGNKTVATIIKNVKNAYDKIKKKSSKWGGIYSLIISLQNVAGKLESIPDEYRSFYLDLSDDQNINGMDAQFIEKISKSGGIIIPKDLQSGDFISFATLKTIIQFLVDDPIGLDWDRVEAEVNGETKKMYKDALDLKAYDSLIQAWEKGISSATKQILDAEDGALESTDYDNVINILNDNTKKTKTDVNWESLGKHFYDIFKKNFGKEKIPESLKRFASYEPRGFRSMRKISSYHGVLQQGHPDGPTNTPWRSIDKRDLTAEHYKDILSSAKEMLESNPWFQSNWDKSAPDAAYRAALDLSIATANGSAYQSKIDAPTYEKLLNNLSKWGYDTFQDTVLNRPNIRKASGLDPELVASKLKSLAKYIRENESPSRSFIASEIHSLLARVS